MAAKGLGAPMKKLTIPDVDPDKPYPMTKPKLGKAVIVNNVHSEQPGSRADVEALKETYERIGLEVEVHNDCDKTKMGRIKRNILANEMHEDSNCFVLSVICHGNNQGHILDVDRRRAWGTEEILSDLSFVQTLGGKPKLLVLQSCRGSERTSGTPYLGEDKNMDPVTLPDKSDTFVAYATVPGYRAHAGDESGSAFIQAFSAYLERHYETHDLDAIYSMVNHYMADVELGESAEKQVSEKRSSLRFPLRFSQFQGKSQGIPQGKPVEVSRPAPKQKLEYPLPPSPPPPRTQPPPPPPHRTQPQSTPLPRIQPPSSPQPRTQPLLPPSYRTQPSNDKSADMQVSKKANNFRLRLPRFKKKSRGIPKEVSVTQLNVKFLITNDTGLVYWGSTSFTVMGTGHIVFKGKTSREKSPAALHMFLHSPEGFKKVREVKSFCEHEGDVSLESVKVKAQEFLAVDCARCRKIRLYDMNSEKVTTAFHDPQYYPGFMSAGEDGVMYVLHCVRGTPVLKLNTQQIPFTGPQKTIQSGMEEFYSVIHIPAPHNLLVFSVRTTATIRAVSSITGEEKWEMRGEVERTQCHPHGMFFSQDHQVLLVADGKNSRILFLNPMDGSVISTIQLDDEMGAIAELCIQKQKLIVQHNRLGKEKVSIFSINLL